ncbi:hypothetical protein NQ318_020312 [Aromia moschata]|uniref:Uncharacterized protein n=1 Tax=Aromia moschata TaxID=1265417 RepID=A0AAV8ZCZ2_9CUCU|nr:hypothetical protein NQ318_020312 [Aromia moschata]
MKRIMTGDETWVYEDDTQTSRRSSEWRYHDEPKPKKPRQSLSKVKVMLTFFFFIIEAWYIPNSFRKDRRLIRTFARKYLSETAGIVGKFLDFARRQRAISPSYDCEYESQKRNKYD